jgi:hypothetical protein
MVFGIGRCANGTLAPQEMVRLSIIANGFASRM